MKILLFALVGLVAQMVDGALGMAFGITSTTLLILTGVGPAHASAAVHVAELGTTFFSGLSHWRLRNVHWPTVIALGLPGAVGAFIGACVLSQLTTESAEPVVSTILLLLGAYVLVRFVNMPHRGSGSGEPLPPTAKTRFGLGALGLTGGMLDATGGGGWGPVTTSTLMTVGKSEPRKIIGTVNTAEFLVALAAVAGFAVGMGDELRENLQPVIGLLVGGAVAAPIAAWVVSVLNPRILGVIVGVLLMVLNSLRLVNHFGPVGVGAVVLVILVVLFALVRNRKKPAAEPEPAAEETAEAPEVPEAATEPETSEPSDSTITVGYRYK